MRPTRIVVQGFSSFRDKTEFDLSDVDLFALSGPTGSGKSSVLDAITFALFGRIPRYGNATGQALNSASKKGVVRVEFTVNGTSYVAVRDLRRTKESAATKEARLERVVEGGDNVSLAGMASEVTDKVEELLGLTYDEFIRVVVLPQGAFAEFLSATPKQRQDLLVNLLGVGIYRDLGQKARDKAGALRTRQSELQAALAELTDATPERAEQLAARVAELTAVSTELVSDQELLEGIRERGHDARAALKTAHADVAAVKGLSTPENVRSLATRMAKANEALDTAASLLADAEKARDDAADALDAFGRAAPVREAMQVHTSLGEMRTRHTDLRGAATTLREQADTAAQAVERAEQAVDNAQGVLDKARAEHAAAVLADGLHAGDDCPVCHRELDVDPDPADTTVVQDAEAALADAKKALVAARSGSQSAGSKATEAESAAATLLDEGKRTAARLTELLDGLPDGLTGDDGKFDAAAAQTWLDQHETLDKAAAKARQDCVPAKKAVAEAQAGIDAFADEAKAAWASFDAERDAVAHLDPPSPSRDDIAEAWAVFVQWGESKVPDLVMVESDRESDLNTAMAEFQQAMAAAKNKAAQADVFVPDNKTPLGAVEAACGAAQAELDVVQKSLERTGTLTAELTEVDHDLEVATDLGKLLDSRNFEKWALHKALTSLTEGASQMLTELSHGAFSLTVNDKSDFAIIDHANADEERSVKSLSGGETFLTSLSLALALSEQVAASSANGARIESLFLDEGFGTLDPDTLDVVAAAIEELASANRTVGIISHVKDLTTGRIPVVFDIRKTPTGSTVEKSTN